VNWHRTSRTGRRLLVAGAVVAAAGLLAVPTASAATGAAAAVKVDTGSIATIAELTGATDLWACGWTGTGVDVALVDTGVAPVPGSGTIVNGPDLSLEAQVGAPRSLDGDGHGSHLASIINGRDVDFSVDPTQCRLGPGDRKVTRPTPATSRGFSGVAPGARVVNVKVGDADGAVDATQVIAAIDWVVQHRNTEGRNIRVLALPA
jgi:serine protease AprX